MAGIVTYVRADFFFTSLAYDTADVNFSETK